MTPKRLFTGLFLFSGVCFSIIAILDKLTGGDLYQPLQTALLFLILADLNGGGRYGS